MVPRPHQSISRAKPEWQLLLESELAQNPRSTVYSLATVHEGAPRVRSVVHRTFSPSGLLLSTTDLRSSKSTQLGAESRTEIAWTLPTLVQFRVTGRAYIVPASGSPNLTRRGSQLKIAASYSSPRNPTPLRRTPSSAAGSSSPTTDEASGATNRDGKRGSVSSTSSLTPGGTAEASPTESLDTKSTTESIPGSGAASESISRSSSTKGRPRLHLTPTPNDLASSAGPSSPLGPGTPRSPRVSPPLSASSTSSYQFHLRPNVALNPAVTLDSESDIGLPKLAGTLSALVSWGVASNAPESSPSWWEAERARIWDSLSPALRATFGRPAPPGSTLADAPDQSTWITSLESNAKDPEESKGLIEAWQNFAVVALAPQRVEMLELSCEPHRRACWVRDGEAWIKEELVP
ncbi:hypothetical protein CcaverHIS002_0407650 [Cutaneotrichosporon cavernicola]|uniref:Pyridoxamine 5'-phosphate oxidase Alr4036 family FMN-binding domain-containing protein n=1 Tax=Cutaneotrichosporon cavernicola TaxID=279322 RepID=A0AA48L4T8_9TREE|nr:uncharacterized protein CcaverHIS019_0407630 [Cutaneotrichosporon cavernicola]BEI84161.1 hypothetical protein CcaverHIS002_0407650 [Cutaneotrichosporon cavernicola]BEI91943.1 hypothetical protein CcaverHIS019_0407630 [Cutaneotrichosporon cavernicola]BEI99714.1 hypothetical protein CcaverHIS631_0407570 [Cutaneotrichosporon cavernicola]BEJ07490.1 hypothetical protein CcaverHIS641_0407590 [Cutaneotrichosporon cavernicola]